MPIVDGLVDEGVAVQVETRAQLCLGACEVGG